MEKNHKRVLRMANRDSHIDNSQCGRPKSAELLEVNENAGARKALTVRGLLNNKTIIQISTNLGDTIFQSSFCKRV